MTTAKPMWTTRDVNTEIPHSRPGDLGTISRAAQHLLFIQGASGDGAIWAGATEGQLTGKQEHLPYLALDLVSSELTQEPDVGDFASAVIDMVPHADCVLRAACRILALHALLGDR